MAWGTIGAAPRSSFIPVPTSASIAPTHWVICLCAAWCRTCDAYVDVFNAAAVQHPHMRFVWVDVEDEADLLGDLDIETFPTLLLANTTQVCFLGPLPPQAGVLARMLASIPAPACIDPQAQLLFERLRAAHP
ncbi:thioredoxin family protein [Giesbergeria sinuosa]